MLLAKIKQIKTTSCWWHLTNSNYWQGLAALESA